MDEFRIPEAPYRSNEDPPFGLRLADALGVAAPSTRKLAQQIFDDLDERVYGIGWWHPHPGTSRRILISDQLLQCTASIEINFVEAKLHCLGALNNWEKESHSVAGAISLTATGQPLVDIPARTCPEEDLPQVMGELHTAGTLRSIGSAMDCLGACIIGVAGLKRSLIKADFDLATKAFRGIRGKGEGERAQLELSKQIQHELAQAGPPGWLDWANALRNMYVHRARRLVINDLRPTTVLYGPRGKRLPRAEALHRLPRSPELSDLEVFFSGDPIGVLAEDARETIQALVQSTVYFTEACAGLLVTFWNRRRNEPDLISQPKEQWPEGPRNPTEPFSGYRPGSEPVSPDQLISHALVQRRLRCGSLAGDAKHNWPKFD